MIRRGLAQLQNHWHGRVALLPTIVLTLIGVRIILAWAGRLRPVDWPLSVVVTVSLASLAILVWQVVGSLRAVRRDGSGLALAGGLAAIVAAIALFLTSELDHYAARAARTIGLPQVVPLPVEHGILRVQGPLDWPLYNRFCATLGGDRGEMRTVALTSDGGLIHVARAMARRISEAGLDTRADGLCASACTLVFVAGHRRTLGPGGELGFHGYRLFGYAPFQDRHEEEERDRAWFASRGIDPAFLARSYSTDHDRLWRPDAATLWAAGILTEPVESAVPQPSNQPDCGMPEDQAANP